MGVLVTCYDPTDDPGGFGEATRGAPSVRAVFQQREKQHRTGLAGVGDLLCDCRACSLVVLPAVSMGSPARRSKALQHGRRCWCAGACAANGLLQGVSADFPASGAAAGLLQRRLPWTAALSPAAWFCHSGSRYNLR